MKKALWLLLLIPAVLTYGAMYADGQQAVGGRMSHRYNETDKALAFMWAIYPPMWLVAVFATNGYEHGFQFQHHHKAKWCQDGTEIDCEWKP